MKNGILYNGQAINIKELSDSTQNWLEYYNSLNDELQDMINYEPYDLKMMIRGAGLQENMVGINTPGNLVVAGSDLNPHQSMYDATTKPIFVPNYWNNNPRILMANCYAHAMNVIASPIQGHYYKLQPGEIYNREIKPKDIQGKTYKEIGGLIAALAIDDITRTPQFFPGITDISICKITDMPIINQYKVALVTAPIPGTTDFFDYHWYKECSNGTWSHKPGKTRALNVDANGAMIDGQNLPDQCNRTYRTGNIVLDYSYFVEYFMVTHL